MPNYRERSAAALLFGLWVTGAAAQQAGGETVPPATGWAEFGQVIAGETSLRGTDSRGDKISIGDTGITVLLPDDSLKLRIGGKMQLDFGSARVRDFRFGKPYNDNLEFRRTWLETYLTIDNAIEFAFQYDFADDTKPINDAAIAYHGIAPFVFTIGNFKEPFSLNQLISDNNTLFTERSLADTFAPARNFGFSAGANGDNWTAAAGVFGGNANTGISDSGIAGTARVTYAPILQEHEVLHLGIAGSYRSLDRDSLATTFSSKPESFLFTTALVSTGAIANAESIGRLGLEAAYQTGPFRLQGEYMRTSVDRSAGQPGTTFTGGYIEAGYTINGNGRPYTLAPKYGVTYAVFGAPKLDASQRVSHGGPGIFELGTRVSYLDLTDRNVRGGQEVDYTFGLNWYPEPYIKLATDYVRAHTSTTPAVGRSVDADVFVGRFQLYW